MTRTDRKAKPIYVDNSSGGGNGTRYYCRTCHVYHIQSIAKCPMCGERTPTEGMLKADDFPIMADMTTPMIANKNPEKAKRDDDLPAGGVWVEKGDNL